MNDQVEVTIGLLREFYGAKNDAELARRLRVGQSTISGWRARGHVPLKIANRLSKGEGSEDLQEPSQWTEIQSRAHAIALARYVILMGPQIEPSNIDNAMSLLLDMRNFWLIMYHAVEDIRSKVSVLRVEPETAQALVLQDDLRDPSATFARIKATLLEDIRDNTWLADWK